MQQIFKSESGVSLNLTIPRFNSPTDGKLLDRIPDLWLKTRATTLERDEDAEYWQVGLELSTILQLTLGTLIILAVFRKRRRVRK